METSGRQAQNHAKTSAGDKRGDKWETSVKSCGPGRPEWETNGRQVGDKSEIMRPRAVRVENKCGRQVEDKCKVMRPRAPRVGASVGQVEGKC